MTAASAMLAHLLVFHTRLFAAVRGRPVVTGFFSATTTLFTLFLAFSASHAWTNDNAARAADVGDGVRWMLLLLLGFIALVSMAMCHADRPETSQIAVTVLALAMASVMAVSAMYESPYTGLHAIGPKGLAALLADPRPTAR